MLITEGINYLEKVKFLKCIHVYIYNPKKGDVLKEFSHKIREYEIQDQGAGSSPWGHLFSMGILKVFPSYRREGRYPYIAEELKRARSLLQILL